MAAKIVSSCGNWFWLWKRFPAAETETTPPELHKDSLEEKHLNENSPEGGILLMEWNGLKME